MSTPLLNKISMESQHILQGVGTYADQVATACYLVGGVVRDLLLDRPVEDLDIVVEADAIEFCKPLAQRFQASLAVYPRFGTATLTWPNGRRVDFTSARQERYPHPGALPEVTSGSLRDDLLRRDFTINALAVCLNQQRYGAVIDFFQGQEDLRGKIIRIFHSQSFIDDPTRILRAIRFSVRYGFSLSAESSQALMQAIQSRAWESVSAGRYFEEFRKMLSEDTVVACLQRLEQLQALDFLGPQIHFTRSHQEDCICLKHILEWLHQHQIDSAGLSIWLVYFMILVGDRPLDELQEMVCRLSLSRHESKKIMSFKIESDLVKRLDPGLTRPSQIFYILRSLSLEEIVVLLVKLRDCPPVQCLQNFLLHYRNVQLHLKGEDLMRLGIRDGRRMGLLLQRLLAQKIDLGFSTKEEEMRCLQELISS